MEHLSFSHLNFQSICVTDCLLQVLAVADPLLEVIMLMKVKVKMVRVVKVNMKMVMNMNMWMVMDIFWLIGDNDPYYDDSSTDMLPCMFNEICKSTLPSCNANNDLIALQILVHLLLCSHLLEIASRLGLLSLLMTLDHSLFKQHILEVLHRSVYIRHLFFVILFICNICNRTIQRRLADVSS